VLSTDAHHFLGCDHALSISGFEGPLIGLDEPKTIGVQIESIYSIALLPESGVKTLMAGRIAADNTSKRHALASRTAVPFDFPPCLPKPPTGSFVVNRDSARRKRVSMDDGGGSGLILEMSSTRALSNSAFAPLSG
jgi:hypothetical protein